MWAIPLIILVLVAIHHRWRVRRHSQSSWKGGGFAMFTEIERNSDLTELSVKTTGGSPASLRVIEQKLTPSRLQARTIPAAKNWFAWGREIFLRHWMRCGDGAYPLMWSEGRDEIEIEQVTVRHRYLDFDGTDGVYSAKEMARYSVDSKGKQSRSGS